MFQAKVFYRKLESLLSRIEDGVPNEELLAEITRLLGESFSEELSIRSGALYRRTDQGFELVNAWTSSSVPPWPAAVSATDPQAQRILDNSVTLLAGHPVNPASELPSHSAWVAIGGAPNYLMGLLIADEFEPERLEFCLHAIGNDLERRFKTAWYEDALDEARRVQLSLLPQHPPVFPGYDIAAHILPATNVGGDFYDFIPTQEQGLGFAIGDASGHGLGAALQVRDAVTGLRMGIESDFRISGTLAKLNRVIHRSSLSTRFVSLFYGELDKSGHIFYVNAGHPPPYRLTARAEIELLDVRGLVLGPMPDTRYQRGYSKLEPGELLVLVTDGVLERQDWEGHEFGDSALPALLTSSKWRSAREALEAIWDAAVEHAERAPWSDDATLVVIRREP